MEKYIEVADVETIEIADGENQPEFIVIGGGDQAIEITPYISDNDDYIVIGIAPNSSLRVFGDFMYINDIPITIGVGDEVTISTNSNREIIKIDGLDSFIEGVPGNATVGVTSSEVTINGVEFFVDEGENTNYKVILDESGYPMKVQGLSDGAIFRDASYSIEIETDGDGTFYFGDTEYPKKFKVDNNGEDVNFFYGEGQVEIYNFNGEVEITGNEDVAAMINSQYIDVYNYDSPEISVTVTATEYELTAIKGLKNGDTLNGDLNGVEIFMPGATGNKTVTLMFDGTKYELSNDEDGITIIKNSPNTIISGLSSYAKLEVRNDKTFTVTGDNSDFIILDENGVKSDYVNKDFTVNNNSTTEEILQQISKNPGKYITIYEGTFELDNDGENNVVVPDEATGEIEILLGNGENNVVVGETAAEIMVRTDSGQYNIVSKSDIFVDAYSAGMTKVTPLNDARIIFYYIDSSYLNGTGIQTAFTDVVAAVKNNSINFGNGDVSIKGAGSVFFSGYSDDLTRINLYDQTKNITKLGFSHGFGVTVDMSDEFSEVVVVGNYDGNKMGSSLIGGVGDDTIFAGAEDTIYAGEGKNLIELSKNRSDDMFGAVISSAGGDDTISGFKFGVDNDSDEIIFNNGIDTISIDNQDVIINGYFRINDAAGEVFKLNESYLKVAEDQIIYDGVTNIYWAIGENSTLKADSNCPFESLSIYLDGSDDVQFFGDIKYLDFSNFYGAAILVGDENDNVLVASDGDSTLDGGAGNDTLIGGEGADLFIYNADNGSDVIENISANDTLKIIYGTYETLGVGSDLIVKVGNDSITVKNGVDLDFVIDGKNERFISGTDSNEIFNIDKDFITVYAGEGDDTIYNKGRYVSINAGEGNNFIQSSIQSSIGSYYYSYVTINSGAGNDTIQNYSGNATINAGAGDDLISISSSSENVLVQYASGDGNDTIYGLNYYDTLQISGEEYSTVAIDSDLIVKVGSGSILVKDGVNASFNIEGTLEGSGINISNDISNTIITGTDRDDSISNSADNVTIDSGAGSDTIHNSGDSVMIDAGAGDDSINNNYLSSNVTIDGGAGDDYIYNTGDSVSISAGDGNDSIENYWSSSVTIDAGAGDDSIENHSYNVIINGGAGNDTIHNTGVSVTIDTGEGNDSIANYSYNVIINGGVGNDTITNSGDSVLIDGGAGNDYISLDAIRNLTINGGTGDDTIYSNYESHGNLYLYSSGDGNDIIEGFKSNDTLLITDGTYSTLKRGNDFIVSVKSGSVVLKDLLADPYAKVVIQDSTGEVTIYNDWKIMSGTSKNDSMTNYVDAVTILSGAGNDSILNYGDSVTIDAGEDNNSVRNDGDNASIKSGSGDDTILSYGDLSTSACLTSYYSSYVTINSGAGNDVIENYSEDAKIDAGAGDDSIYNIGEQSTINAGDGNDTVINYGNQNYIDGGAGNDSVYNWYGNSVTIDGGAGDDSIENHSYNVIINGGDGADSIHNTGDSVTIDTGEGNDSVYNQGNYVSINGGSGNDTLVNYSYYYYHVSQTSYSYGSYVSIAGETGDDIISLVGDSYNGKTWIEYKSGDGNDTIYGLNYYDTLQISGEEYSTVAIDSDLIVKVGSGSILVKDGVNASFNIEGTLKGSGVNISNNISNTIITGTDRDDSISNYVDYVTIDAGDGDDYIDLDSEIYFEGTHSGDYVSVNGGAGNDYIHNNSGGHNVTIDGGTGDDYIYTWGEKFSINGGSGNDSIEVIDSNFIESTVEGGDGDDYIYVSKIYETYQNIIDGGKGNDTIKVAGISQSTLTGGAGNDLISLDSDSRNNLIQYKASDGNDTVYGLSSDNTLQITGASYSTTKSGSDLVVKVGSDSILVKGGANSALTIDGTIDGGISNTETLPVGITVKNSVLTASTQFKGDEINLNNYVEVVTKVNASAVSQAVNIVGNDLANSIKGGKGADTITGGLGKNTLTGGNGTDVFVHAGGNDVITDYKSGKDKILLNPANITNSTVKGSDVILTTGEGTVTIKTAKDKAVTFLDEGGDSTELIFFGDTSYAPLNTGLTYDAKRTVLTASAKFTGNEIDFSEYLSTVTKVNASAVSQAVNIIGSDSANSIKGGKGADTITGGLGKNTLTGGNGADVFVYAGGNDLITDYKAGEDRILLNPANITNSTVKGSDVILTTDEGSVTIKSAKDKVVTFLDEGGDSTVLIFFSDTSYAPLNTGLTYDTKRTILTASNKFTGNEFDLSEYLSTVTKVNASAVSQAVNIIGSDSANSIKGGKGADTITGGLGKNTLTGGNGADIFVYAGGNDLITDYKAGEDKILLNPANITNSTVKGSDVILTTGEGIVTIKTAKDKVVTFLDEGGDSTDLIFFGDTSYAPLNTGLTYDAKRTILTASNKFTGNKIDLSDYLSTVTKVNASAVSQAVNIIGSDSANSIKGGKGADTITGGFGKNTLTGGNGADIFIYAGGNDLITDYKPGEDRILLNPANITNSTVKGSDVILTTSEGTVTIKSAKDKVVTFLDEGGDSTDLIFFADTSYAPLNTGLTYDTKRTILTASAKFTDSEIDLTNYLPTVTKINANSVSKNLNIVGNDSGNSIKGGKGADTISGGIGNDTLTGGSGKDVFIYSGGNDLITDYKADEDSIQLAGVTVTGDSLKGSNLIIQTDKGNLTIQNGKGKNISYVETLELLSENNFLTDENTLDLITEQKFSVQNIDTENKFALAQDSTMLTFNDK